MLPTQSRSFGFNMMVIGAGGDGAAEKMTIHSPSGLGDSQKRQGYVGHVLEICCQCRLGGRALRGIYYPLRTVGIERPILVVGEVGHRSSLTLDVL